MVGQAQCGLGRGAAGGLLGLDSGGADGQRRSGENGNGGIFVIAPTSPRISQLQEGEIADLIDVLKKNANGTEVFGLQRSLLASLDSLTPATSA